MNAQGFGDLRDARSGRRRDAFAVRARGSQLRCARRARLVDRAVARDRQRRGRAPYQAGGDWLVDRTTTVLPMCNYINASGNYSLRSYSLSPEDKIERVMICRGNAAVAPYAGPCPPK